jgi:hypothetical protein
MSERLAVSEMAKMARRDRERSYGATWNESKKSFHFATVFGAGRAAEGEGIEAVCSEEELLARNEGLLRTAAPHYDLAARHVGAHDRTMFDKLGFCAIKDGLCDEIIHLFRSGEADELRLFSVADDPRAASFSVNPLIRWFRQFLDFDRKASFVTDQDLRGANARQLSQDE